jgi:hypothetical protein
MDFQTASPQLNLSLVNPGKRSILQEDRSCGNSNYLLQTPAPQLGPARRIHSADIELAADASDC